MISPPDRAYSRSETWEPACARKGCEITKRQYSGDSAAKVLPTAWASWEWSAIVPGTIRRSLVGGQMSTQAELRCRCGEVVGAVTNASPQTVNRVVCYCDDCQAFAHQLGRADLLDAKGGSDIVQVAPASLTFVKGQDRIAGVRLTPKGSVPVPHDLLQHAGRQHAEPCDSVRRDRRAGIRYRNAARRSGVRRTCRCDFRKMRDRRAAGRAPPD